MKAFKDYYTQDQILKYLCKIRIAYANKRHKKCLLDKLTKPANYLKKIQSNYDDEILQQLGEMLPKRRLWLCGGQRTKKLTRNIVAGTVVIEKIDTDEKNREILYNTIKKHISSNGKFEYVDRLLTFIAEIQEAINEKAYQITSPDIIPEIKETNKSLQKLSLKKSGSIECRPISRFSLKDRIVISLTNKFLTKLFDEFFEDSSLAFRATKSNDVKVKNHHLAVNRIIEYKAKNIDRNLWVAECDMKKFYDTVNHKMCLNAFFVLINKITLKYANFDLSCAIHIFENYLKCYNFKDNVKVLNEPNYWVKQLDSKRRPINGCFPWIDEELARSPYYKLNQEDKIGVPQGGAISGLIANILLDYSDKKLKDIDGLFYVRYCDDMIMMHDSLEVCSASMKIYQASLKDLALFNHPFKTEFMEVSNSRLNKKTNEARRFKLLSGKEFDRAFSFSYASFWDCKSKGPYLWGKFDMENKVFPWIGFVGYEINFLGETRIRKKSLKKELDKQKKVVASIADRIKTPELKNARNNMIYRSALEKLNGMSVGRIKLYNFQDCRNKICWTDGFQCINLNRFSKVQLRTLDRNKYKSLNILRMKIGAESLKAKVSKNNDEILQINKPFSYYYQAGEKKMRKP